MPDEFPTLEAALGVSILVLAWRLGLLLRALGRVQARPELGRSDPFSGERGRASRRARRVRGRASADLVIAAVLGGALTYAAAELDLRPAFLVLGAVAFLLLLSSAFVHSRLARALGVRGNAHAGAGAGAGAGVDAGNDGPERALSCPECGRTEQTSLRGSDELGTRLTALGVESLFVCSRCGCVHGRARAESRASARVW